MPRINLLPWREAERKRKRQEFILLSDTLGLSMLVVELEQKRRSAAALTDAAATVALPAGRYLLRRRETDRVWEAPLEVRAGQATAMSMAMKTRGGEYQTPRCTGPTPPATAGTAGCG
jgi:hypothetical protein